MAYTVEDGSGVVGANSYQPVADISAYLADRGRSAEGSWNSIGANAQQVAAIKGADAFEQLYGCNVIGEREFPEAPDGPQGLSFPRTGVVVDGELLAGVPARVKTVHAELTVLGLVLATSTTTGSALIPSPDPESIGRGAVIADSQRLDEETITQRYAEVYQGATGNYLPVYTAIELLVKPLLNSSSIAGGGPAFGRVVRA